MIVHENGDIEYTQEELLSLSRGENLAREHYDCTFQEVLQLIDSQDDVIHGTNISTEFLMIKHLLGM